MSKPNREIYKSSLWRSIEPIDRIHFILVAERLKPAAYCGVPVSPMIRSELEKNLGIFISEVRGSIEHAKGSNKIFLPYRSYTIYQSEEMYEYFREKEESANTRSDWQRYDGELLGYPQCCVKEYTNPTYKKRFNKWILNNIKRPYTFMIEHLIKSINNEKIADEFNFRMPSQTPCSVKCQKSIELLSKWKAIIRKYDPIAEIKLREFRKRSEKAYFLPYVNKFKSMRLSAKMFEEQIIRAA